MSAWRNIKTQPEIACPLDAVDSHAAIEMKRVAPDVIAIAEQGPQSIAGVNPAALAQGLYPYRLGVGGSLGS